MDEEKKQAGVEDHLKALNEIVEKLEKGDLSLEESLKVFSEGVARVKEAQELLTAAEEKLRVLTEDGTTHVF